MKPLLGYFLALLLVAAGLPAQAQEPLVLYDDFNARNIDSAKWLGSAVDFTGAEAVREIVPVNPPDQTERQLHLAYRSLGRPTSNAGTERSGLRLNFVDPNPITAIKATIQVGEAEAVGCGANPGVTLATARLLGTFFNTGPAAIPGSGVNDVFAQIRIERSSSAPGLPVRGRAFRCTDPNCFAGPPVGPDVDLGFVIEGMAVTLEMRWEPDNDRFVFRKDTVEGTVSYTESDTAAPGLALKAVDVRHFIENCIAEQTSASMDIFVDDVLVNLSAAP